MMIRMEGGTELQLVPNILYEFKSILDTKLYTVTHVAAAIPTVKDT